MQYATKMEKRRNSYGKIDVHDDDRKTQSRKEAEEICKSEPLVAGGYATCKLVGLQIANRENNYLL